MDWYVDVGYRGHARLIACGVLETPAGLYLVDPGPEVSLGGLEAGLARRGAGLGNVRGLLLTHIHLDHAGATGAVVRRHPRIKVFVHERGARHVVQPERLLASARRIYGERMETLYGTLLPVPADNVRALAGGENLDLDGRRVQVAYTPGHASHHVAYLDDRTGTAFVGDTAGMRVTGLDYIVPVAPPPDIHMELWADSLRLLRGWAPERLFLTHFGPTAEPAGHMAAMERRLRAWADAVRASLDDDGDDRRRARAFHATEMARARSALSGVDLEPYLQMGQPDASWYGIARYWRKHGGANDYGT